MNNKRRGRGNVPRRGSPEPLIQGVYSNQHFTTTSTNFVGCTAQVDVAEGKSYIGVFSSFSSQFEVVLEFAQLITDGPGALNTNKPTRRMIFDAKHIVHMTIKNADPRYATRDGAFQTDASISKYDRNGQLPAVEKELQPWTSECNGEDVDLTLGTEPGWDANAMFKRNEERYGVQSNFDHSLAGYTTAIERSDSKGFREAEAKAARIANEIEKSSKSQAQAELENGDEEERFAAVIRPTSPPRNQDKTGKYIPPVRRQGSYGQGRLAPRSAPFPPGHVSSPAPEDSPQRTDNSPVSTSDDNRNNNNNSPSTAPARNGNGRKPYVVQPGYPYSQPPRYMISQPIRPLPPANQPAAIHGPPPAQPIPVPVYTQSLPPNHQTAIPTVPVIQQESPIPLQPVVHPTPNVSIVHGVDPSGLAHVHIPPHAVPVALPGTFAQPPPVPHEADLRQRNPGIRAPRVIQTNNKRFSAPQYPLPPRKPRPDEVNDLVEFSANLKLAPSENEQQDIEEKQDSPPIEQWNKGRSPPSNASAEEAANTLKKSTLNPNAKEFNPSAKPFTPRPPNTPGPSRPHTPQTPAQPFGYSPGPVSTVILPYMPYVQPTFTHQATPPRLQMTPRPDISSQVQVQNATGQPLLAPAPIQRFVAPYHPNQPPQPYQQMVRMVHGQGPVMFHEGAPHAVHYMSPHGQHPHPPGQFPQAQPQQFQMLYSVPIPPSTMMQYFQQPPQPGQQQPQHLQVIVPNQ